MENEEKRPKRQRATDATLGLIHTLTAQRLLERLQSGEILTPQEITAISKFLKDNDITASVEEGTPHAELSRAFDGFRDVNGIFSPRALPDEEEAAVLIGGADGGRRADAQ